MAIWLAKHYSFQLLAAAEVFPQVLYQTIVVLMALTGVVRVMVKIHLDSILGAMMYDHTATNPKEVETQFVALHNNSII
jgi:hypothetical protein